MAGSRSTPSGRIGASNCTAEKRNTAARPGKGPSHIRQQTGHDSDAMLARYIRDGELFVDNAAGCLL
jgi:hypothetical protein